MNLIKIFKNEKNYSILFALLISACQKTIPDSPEIIDEEEVVRSPNDNMIVLGEKLTNPYTIENMRNAYGLLKSEDGNFPDMNIEPSHLYVRFLPANISEYDTLAWNECLYLYDYPLDYEIAHPGHYYHDPEIPDTMITWQYCSVPIEMEMPKIEYELLAELFLPEEVSDKSSENLSHYFARLEYKALELAGDVSVLDKSTQGAWYPSGKIRYKDTNLGTKPVVGAKVQANRWFTTKEDYTDSNGDFFISHQFSGKVDYRIKWETNDYDLRSGGIGQAYTSGPNNSEEPWDDLEISSGGMPFVYAMVHKAAYRMYYQSIGGLTRPPFASEGSKMKIGCYDDDKDCRITVISIGCLRGDPEVKIYKQYENHTYNQSFDSESWRLYKSTIHELTHWAHWKMPSSFCDVDKIIVESWAITVAYFLGEELYPGFQNQKQSETKMTLITDWFQQYTPLFFDLIDDHNQRSGASDIWDPVKDYSLLQLENVVEDVETLEELKTQLWGLYEKPTEQYLDTLFSSYIYVRDYM